MKKNTTRDKLLRDRPLSDDDIEQVFNAQDVHIPEGLDSEIFKQAELVAKQAKPRTRTPWPTHAFSIAATVVLTILLAPALMREPINPEEASIAAADMAESTASPPQVKSVSNNLTERKLTEIQSGSSSASTESNPAYRETAERWIYEIKIMIIDGDSDRARAEYLLFEKQFPEKAKDFNPDFNARAIQTESLRESDELQGN